MRGKIKLRWFGVLVILILLGMAAVQINAKVLDTTTQTIVNNDPKPKLCCFGSIERVNVKAGGVVVGNFTVYNCGEEGSLLNWEVADWPKWGNEWTFNDFSGTGLQKDVYHTVTVSVEVPDKPEKSFTGDIKIVNSDDPSDFSTINVYLITSKTHYLPYYHFLEKLMENYPIMGRILNTLLRL